MTRNSSPATSSVRLDDLIEAIKTVHTDALDPLQDAVTVDPSMVRTTRAQTANRTRPWTHDELLAMLPAGQGGK